MLEATNSTRQSKIKKVVREATVITAIVAAALLLIEGCFRLGGRPFGDFEAIFRNGQLYPPDQTLTLTWGPILYIVTTNNHGFRGKDFVSPKPIEMLRILTIGDSITDGFFVDNADTWQPALQENLIQRLSKPIEVINGARGGGSIGKELAMLKANAVVVDPDIVLLTFVTNDIKEIMGSDLAELLARDLSAQAEPMSSRLQQFLVTQTATGEFFFHTYLSGKSRHYRNRAKRNEVRFDANRYAIDNGDAYEENVIAFKKRTASSDEYVLGSSFSNEVELKISHYIEVLKVFSDSCRAMQARLVFIYFPAYSQVYDESTSQNITVRLRKACASLGIEFLDLTPGFRKEGKRQVLHLAPLDFHLNPAGNRVFATLVSDYLVPSLETLPSP